MSDYKLRIDINERMSRLEDIYGNAPIRNCHYGSDYVIDFNVGSTIEVNGANIQVVEDETETDVCKHCIFKIYSLIFYQTKAGWLQTQRANLKPRWQSRSDKLP